MGEVRDAGIHLVDGRALALDDRCNGRLEIRRCIGPVESVVDDLVAGEDRERGLDVVAEELVVIVSDDNHDVRLGRGDAISEDLQRLVATLGLLAARVEFHRRTKRRRVSFGQEFLVGVLLAPVVDERDLEHVGGLAPVPLLGRKGEQRAV